MGSHWRYLFLWLFCCYFQGVDPYLPIVQLRHGQFLWKYFLIKNLILRKDILQLFTVLLLKLLRQVDLSYCPLWSVTLHSTDRHLNTSTEVCQYSAMKFGRMRRKPTITTSKLGKMTQSSTLNPTGT